MPGGFVVSGAQVLGAVLGVGCWCPSYYGVKFAAVVEAGTWQQHKSGFRLLSLCEKKKMNVFRMQLMEIKMKQISSFPYR